MTGVGFVNGHNGGRDPLLHAGYHPPVPATDTGGTYLAACGTRVRNLTTVEWNPAGPGRRCGKCRREVARLGRWS